MMFYPSYSKRVDTVHVRDDPEHIQKIKDTFQDLLSGKKVFLKPATRCIMKAK